MAASTPGNVFTNPATQLGPSSTLAANAAVNPFTALAFSPAMRFFNPAINPNAALLAFNPAAAPNMALTGTQGPASLPFGMFLFGI